MRKVNGPTNKDLVDYFASINDEDREAILTNVGLDSFLLYGVIENFLTEKAHSERIDPELELLKTSAGRRSKSAHKKNTIYSTWLATALKARSAGYSYDMLVQFINSKQTRYKISKSYLYHLLAPFQDIINRMRDGYIPSAEEIESVIAGDQGDET